MKSARRIANVVLFVLAIVVSGCVLGDDLGPGKSCRVSSECSSGTVCYRGFCVEEATGLGGFDAGATSDDDAASGPMQQPEHDAASAIADAAVEPSPAVDASAQGPTAPNDPRSDASTADATTDATTDGAPMAPVEPPPAAPTDAGAGVPDAAPPANPEVCTRELLEQRAAQYFAALAVGDPAALRRHASARYTENGQTVALGSGLWQRRPRTEFARHALDEARCSSVSVAVLADATQRLVFGLRLRYVEGQLIDAEAMVVPPNNTHYEPDSLIPKGVDAWTQPVPAAGRTSREALIQLATSYFDASVDPSLLPPHTDSCRRRQNGALMGSGSCGVRPGSKPFEERRYPVVDETLGVVTAVIMYERFIGLYLFKVQSRTIEIIDVVGGAAARSTGW